jgi:hypothetical protein
VHTELWTLERISFHAPRSLSTAFAGPTAFRISYHYPLASSNQASRSFLLCPGGSYATANPLEACNTLPSTPCRRSTPRHLLLMSSAHEETQTVFRSQQFELSHLPTSFHELNVTVGLQFLWAPAARTTNSLNATNVMYIRLIPRYLQPSIAPPNDSNPR